MDEFTDYLMNKGRASTMANKRSQEYDHSVIYITVKEIAKSAKCGTAAIYADIRQGLLVANEYIIGVGRKRLLIHPDEAERYLKEKETKK